ncbi:glycosyltransferase family 2 protein [Mameliella alba]|uniref:Glycosyltransferase n=1 Tax=Mameliella alba TaxID=561184 RepID=A0A0B3S0Q3_9RHOB|nr:glycosyltransferase family 2 protein [Mameliella alba]KHQ50171.1 Glycosyltransferase [Mameliella alba]
MPISETDISILIPTYRYRDKVGRAVESALASGAGEIIVTDDRSGDGTMELLAGYDDPRLRVYENPRNLGLWENHLEALGHATKPWIKFIQADDYLLPGGLAAYAAGGDPGVTVVWSCAVVKDDETGAVMQYNDLDAPRRLDGEALLETCIYMGWLLGAPSHMMVRADAIERDPAAWDSDISADVVLGTVAAARGAVALLPPGAIGQGAHARQDAKTQGLYRGLRRLIATPAYLQARPEPALRRFAALWAAMNAPMALRAAVSGTLRGDIPPLEAVRLVLRNRALARGAGSERALLDAARAYRREARTPHDVAVVVDRLQSSAPVSAA